MTQSPDTPGHGATRRRIELAALLALIAVAVVLAVMLFTRGGDSEAADSAAGASDASPARISESDRNPAVAGEMGPLGDLSTRIEGDPLAMGSVDAPVVMVEFADYRCPFCAKFSTDIEPQLIRSYVDSGQLRIEWRDLPIFGDESMLAARAARAAGAQGTFWEFNRTLYAAAPGNGHPEMTPDKLRGFAQEAGVPDLDLFTAQMNSGEFDEAIRADAMVAQQLGIPATPAFSINGHPVLGAQPAEEFTDLIDRLLGEAETA